MPGEGEEQKEKKKPGADRDLNHKQDLPKFLYLSSNALPGPDSFGHFETIKRGSEIHVTLSGELRLDVREGANGNFWLRFAESKMRDGNGWCGKGPLGWQRVLYQRGEFRAIIKILVDNDFCGCGV